MSLLSLKKSRPSAERPQVSVDSFIEDALHYASGASTLIGNAPGPGLHHAPVVAANSAMRRATFTLDNLTIDTLACLSQQTDISRSRLIRIWAAEQARRDNENLLCATTV